MNHEASFADKMSELICCTHNHLKYYRIYLPSPFTGRRTVPEDIFRGR